MTTKKLMVYIYWTNLQVSLMFPWSVFSKFCDAFKISMKSNENNLFCNWKISTKYSKSQYKIIKYHTVQ